MSSFKFWNDSGMTSPATSIAASQAADGSSAAVDRVVYLGSTVASKKLNTEVSPGTGTISVSLSDSTPGSGVQATHVKLASTNGGLAGATAGAALALGTQVLSGAGNAVPVHLRIDTPVLAAAVYTDVTLVTNSVVELDV